jgi:hypothetical protein
MNPPIKMPKPKLEVADILRLHIAEYRNAYPLAPEQHRIVSHLLHCRTPTPDGQIAAFINRCGLEGDLRPFSCKKPSHTKLDTSVPFRLTVGDTRAEHPRPPQSSGPQHPVPSLPLTHKAKSPYTRTHLKQVLIAQSA